MTAAISGGCLCGACRYETDAAPINMRACHCHLCQKAIGAAFNARVLVPLDAVTITGPVRWFNSSDDLKRGFCPECGTTLFSARASINAVGITTGTLDDQSVFAPTEHIWMSSSQAWLRLDDGLPRYAEGPPPV